MVLRPAARLHSGCVEASGTQGTTLPPDQRTKGEQRARRAFGSLQSRPLPQELRFVLVA